MRPPDEMTTDRRDRSRDKAKSRDKDDVIKPPRPPCWQDFTRSGKSLSFSDLHLAKDSSSVPGTTGSVQGSGSSCAGGSTSGSRRQRPLQPQRRKNRLHRTRSEACISRCGLTEEDYTNHLADMHPRQLGLQRRSDFDNRLYFDESMQRCRRWLADVKASEPFEDCTENCDKISVLSSPDTSDVELEIPDESGSMYDRTVFDSHRDPRLKFPGETITEEAESLDADDVTITCDDVTVVVTKETSRVNPKSAISNPPNTESVNSPNFARPLHNKRINGRSKGQGRSRTNVKDKEKGNIK